ncbi:hypothetical protein CEY07_03140 [Bacillus safensis]|nr:hypothetical protein AMR95_06005 [Bacillus sp. G1(2015b)]KUR60383.1 hypothetical protein AOQ70_06570 [Bacillus sp. AM 13(2015)]PCK13329.1 hypothetical protein CEY07_03140 [Bacillus safensis]
MADLYFFEKMSELSHIVLVLCAYAFYWRLKKTRNERKLTNFELFLKYFILFGVLTWGISFVILTVS